MKVDIGIIGALPEETSRLISVMEEARCESVSGIDFYSGIICGKSVVVARCGVGKVFASMCAEAMIIKYSPSIMVNSGVGGAISPELNTGDVVIADRLVQHDMDTSPLGDPKGLVSGINVIYFEADKRAVSILKNAAERLGVKHLIGTVASGDRFVSSKEQRAEIASEFSAAACEMEGAAVAHVAYVNSVPFAVIRAISDSADGNAATEYSEFLPMAAKVSSELTLALIGSY